MNEIRTMHLFAGHGGGLLADLILGHKPVVAVEWDSYACQVLRERAADGWFPGLQVWEGDVRLFDPSEYAGKVDCIHAGFPCQDISAAGKQAGVGPETRSGLYREVLRIAGVVRPKQLFLENVSAIITNGLGTVLADLAALGYDTEWLCIRASDCGANHHRDRWFAIARQPEFFPHAEHNGVGRREQQQESIEEANAANTDELGATTGKTGELRCSLSNELGIDTQKERGRNELDVGVSGICQVLAHTHSAQRQRNECAKRIEQEYTDSSSTGWWEVEPELGRVVNGFPNRVEQLKGYGNAQVPLQAAAAYRLLGGM